MDFFGKIADPYFRPKGFERANDAQFYRALGMHHAKRAVIGLYNAEKAVENAAIDWIRTGHSSSKPNRVFEGHDAPMYFLAGSSVQDLKNYDTWSRRFEAIHLGVASLGMIGLITSPAIAAVGIGVNGYLALMQRYNRARAYNTLEKMKAKAFRNGK